MWSPKCICPRNAPDSSVNHHKGVCTRLNMHGRSFGAESSGSRRDFSDESGHSPYRLHCPRRRRGSPDAAIFVVHLLQSLTEMSKRRNTLAEVQSRAGRREGLLCKSLLATEHSSICGMAWVCLQHSVVLLTTFAHQSRELPWSAYTQLTPISAQMYSNTPHWCPGTLVAHLPYSIHTQLRHVKIIPGHTS